MKIAGQEGTLVLNEPARLTDGRLTLTEGEENKIKVTVETGAAAQTEAAPEETESTEEAPTS